MPQSPATQQDGPPSSLGMASTGFAVAFQRGVQACVECARDSSEEVRDRIQASLLSLAQKDFGLVLDTVCRYLMEQKSGSTPQHQRVTLLKALRSVATTYDEHIGDKLILDLTTCACMDMTAQIDINSPWQQAAAELATELCGINPSVAVPHVMSLIPGTSLPHYFVLRVLSEAAERRPLRFMPHMKECMSKVLPILGMAKQDNIRFSFADALASFADAVSQLNNLPELSPRAAGASQYQPGEFADAMYTALTLLLNEWTGARELRVRTTVTMALGKLALVIAPDRLEEKLPALVKILTQGVQREKPRDALCALRGMSFFVRACVEKVPGPLMPHAEMLWQTVFKCVVQFHGMKPQEQCELLKCHQEMMRAMEHLCMGIPDTVLNFVQKTLDPKFGSKDPVAKCAALGTLQHLVQQKSLDERLSQLKNHVIAIVRTCIEDPDRRVQRAVAQVVMAMGSATENNYLACEGGESLLECVVTLAATHQHVIDEWAAKNKKAVEQGLIGPADVAHISRSVLNLFITTKPNLDLVLWPFVLEVVGMCPSKPELINIFPLLANAVVEIGKRLGNTHDFYFDFEKKVNVPRPEALIATFLPIAAQATHLGKQHVSTVLSAMETIAPLLDEPMKRSHDGTTPLGSLWLGTVPELKEYVNSEEFNQTDYEEACFVLLKKSVTCKKEEGWSQAVVGALASQLHMWCHSSIPADYVKGRHDMKRVALNMFGLGLSKVNLKTFVSDHINILVETTDHTNELQRDGCAKAFGHVSTQYCDSALDKLNRVAKPPKQQSGGLFSKKVESGPDRDFGELSRATVLLAFGHVARRAPQQLFTSRLETHVVPTYLELIQAAKQPAVKEAALVGLQMLAAALRKCGELSFVSKPKVVNAVVGQMLVDAPGAVDATAFTLLHEGVKALIPTTYLDPACDAELGARLKQCTAAGFTKVWANPTDLRKAPEAEKQGSPPRQVLPESALLKQVGLLSCAQLESAPSITEALIDLTTHFAPYMRSPQEHERERAAQSLVTLLKHFGKQVDRRGHDLEATQSGPVELGGGEFPSSFSLPAAPATPADAKKKGKDDKRSSFSFSEESRPKELALGTLIARLVPRIADGSRRVRECAVDALTLCLKLHLVTYGEGDGGVGRAIETSKGLSGRLDFRDESDMVAIMKDVSGALCGFVGGGGKELALLVDELIVRGLVDPVIDSAVAVCATLAQLFKNLGGAGEQGARPFISDEEVVLFATKLVAALLALSAPGGSPAPGREDAFRGVLLALKALCKNRPTLIFNHLLTYSVPHAPHIVRAVQTLANDTGLSRLLANHCLDVLLNAQLFEEGYQSGSQKLSLCSPVVAAVCTAGELFETAKGAEVARLLQAPLVCSLLLLQAASHEAPRVHLSPEQQKECAGAPPRPQQLVNKALRSFASAVYGDSLNERAARHAWEQLESDSGFPQGCAQLITFIVHEEHSDGDRSTPAGEHGAPLELQPTTVCPIVEELYEFMRNYVQKVYDCHRWCAMTVLGQLLYHCKGSDTLLQGLIHALLGRAGSDEKIMIKLQAVRGFGHVPVHPYESIAVYVAPVIASLVTCCADASIDVCLVSMSTLEQFIQRIRCATELSAVVVNICLRTKACLDLPDPRMRAAGCSLFGVMAKLSVAEMIDYGVLEPNVHGHLAAILVHVNDSEPQVRFSCKTALHEIVAWLNVAPPSRKAREHMERLFAKEHVGPTKVTNYDEFANDFTKIWVRFYEHRINDLLVALAGYFASTWPAVRAAAAIMCGTILRHLGNADQARSNLESTCSGLMALLRKDPEPLVRSKAAKALGMLGDMR